MRRSTAIPEPSLWLVRSGDAKIDCRIAGARCSENGGSQRRFKKTTTHNVDPAETRAHFATSPTDEYCAYALIFIITRVAYISAPSRWGPLSSPSTFVL
jgi:hypothetical protein